eukprot:scaffold36795_cov19-Prasinocladus_malaysianus.AAC.1
MAWPMQSIALVLSNSNEGINNISLTNFTSNISLLHRPAHKANKAGLIHLGSAGSTTSARARPRGIYSRPTSTCSRACSNR